MGWMGERVDGWRSFVARRAEKGFRGRRVMGRRLRRGKRKRERERRKGREVGK